MFRCEFLFVVILLDFQTIPIVKSSPLSTSYKVKSFYIHVVKMFIDNP